MSSAMPLKKRRGRPPKYLMVWQQQQQLQQQQSGPGEVDGAEGQQQSTLLTDRITPPQRPVSIITPLPRCLDGGPTDLNNNSVGSGGCSQPLKKRPGRPPGCTKRPRPTPLATQGPGAATRSDFSLRKFFEAGGRDYNEYLEWITAAKAISSITPPDSRPSSGTPSANLALHPLTSPSFASFPGLVLPGSPPVALTPPAAAAAGCTPPAPLPSACSPKTTRYDDSEALDLSAKRHLQCDPLRRTDEQKENVERHLADELSSWSVDRVADFVSTVPGCQAYAQDFREQQIDGTSLPHLSEEHLLNCVRMKLGPAIRLRLAISRLQPIY
ncbi:hypothetical protein CAPTEDRAFT_226340 [Capitella teleta]|uniref:SAM domain-containing protein n=1 Tax=Capitella teleta TaxID=283909 RepID=R7TV84_CAPTE|nr:hypothetical protein CAPTEDRAFT_226340 [Capitella teleta]|eukprot:ELT97634.1 hypothetical protein CAPTEDRAFT_226340 [Capitella teleta]